MIVILTYKRSIHAFNCEAHRGRRRPVAYHAACRMGIRLAVAAVTSGLVAKNAILDNGNRDQTTGVITHVILCGWFLWCLRFRLRAAIMLFAILGGAIIVGQGVKSWVKERVQEPRPFVVWLEKTHHIPVDEFYTLKRTERGHLVKEQLAGQQNIPVFLRQHWQKRRALRFPPDTPCLQRAGRFWPWVCYGRADGLSPSRFC